MLDVEVGVLEVEVTVKSLEGVLVLAVLDVVSDVLVDLSSMVFEVSVDNVEVEADFTTVLVLISIIVVVDVGASSLVYTRSP